MHILLICYIYESFAMINVYDALANFPRILVECLYFELFRYSGCLESNFRISQ
jgi:hypothetical protein